MFGFLFLSEVAKNCAGNRKGILNVVPLLQEIENPLLLAVSVGLGYCFASISKIRGSGHFVLLRRRVDADMFNLRRQKKERSRHINILYSKISNVSQSHCNEYISLGG